MVQIKSYYNYWRNRVDAHGIHSPFVFDFYNSVLLEADDVNDAELKSLTHQLKKDQRKIAVEDFGAGSQKANGPERKISSIAKTASVNRKFAKLLTRLVERYQLNYIVELGTSLGVGAIALSQPTCVKKLVTIEGSAEIAKIAQENFKNLGVKNIDSLIGKFDDKLEEVTKILPRIDLVYIDGNHRYQPTMDYFSYFIDKIPDNAFIVFDDIYWSAEMEKAWKEICASPKINVSIDLFRMGIVCKRAGQAKQHFVLKY
jgi:predicted O-methyltransferase YrrM